jgi:light-regulated signal transduction histidine kinase (bacteriophytochrome)
MGTGLALYALGKDGREIPVEVSLKPIRLGDYDYVVAAIRDVTDLRQAEITLQQVVAELIDTNAHLEQFAHAASHDLREPLRGLNHYLQLLESRHKTQLNEQAGYYLERALANAARMATLINDLSTYAKMHHRDLETERRRTTAIARAE